MSPTARTLQKLRKDNWLCAVVEKWNPYKRIRQDLFQFADVLAVRGDIVLLVQATSGSNVSTRVSKILQNPNSRLWLASPTRQIAVWGWAKRGERGKRKTWTCREVPVEVGV